MDLNSMTLAMIFRCVPKHNDCNLYYHIDLFAEDSSSLQLMDFFPCLSMGKKVLSV